jgi:hypothetical protein
LLSDEIKAINHPTLDMEVGSLMKRINEYTYAYEYWRKKMTNRDTESERELYNKIKHYLSEILKYINSESELSSSNN